MLNERGIVLASVREERKSGEALEGMPWMNYGVCETEMLTDEGLFGDDVLRHLKEDVNA